MEWNLEALQFLSQCFLHTLSPSPEPQRNAKSLLLEVVDHPNFGLAVIRLIAEPSVDDQIRQATIVHLKNHLSTRWCPAPNTESNNSIPDSKKQQIKTLIVPLMLSSSPRIQSQLSESFAVIGKHDFPYSWPTLLPELILNLRQVIDYSSINGILGATNTIFKKFWNQYKTNELLLDLKYCLDNFATPLLEIFIKTSTLIDVAICDRPTTIFTTIADSPP